MDANDISKDVDQAVYLAVKALLDMPASAGLLCMIMQPAFSSLTCLSQLALNEICSSACLESAYVLL